MVVGVEKSKETLADLAELACDGIDLFKKGIGLGSFGKIVEILADVKELIADAPLALPELADLNAVEAAELGAAAYVAVKKIVDAVRK